jgi:peptidoglycan hydrolase-like protein with peptidoglycan-binding domain
LQSDLTKLGYGDLLGPPGIDGKFGPFTEKAVKQFQIDNGLKGKDGVAGPETWGAICRSLSTGS